MGMRRITRIPCSRVGAVGRTVVAHAHPAPQELDGDGYRGGEKAAKSSPRVYSPFPSFVGAASGGSITKLAPSNLRPHSEMIH